MREPTDAERAFNRAVRHGLDEVNKDPTCGLNILQLIVASQVALQTLMEMNDAEDARKTVEAWDGKTGKSGGG